MGKVTYIPLESTTLNTAQASVTFSNIDQTYTDLILVCNAASETTNAFMYLQFNSDTGTNYSYREMYGNGSTSVSAMASNTSQLFNTDASLNLTSLNSSTIYRIQSYSNPSIYKISYLRQSSINAADYNGIMLSNGLWRSYSPITSITVKATRGGTAYNLSAGSSFRLYGLH